MTRRRLRPTRILVWLAALILVGSATGQAGPLPFDLDLHVPPVVADAQAPLGCTITYLLEDIASGDLFAQRMQIDHVQSDQPVNHRLPCPPNPAPRLAARALETCSSRATDAKTCVFADMARGFEHQPVLENTAENAARCASDSASQLGVACWMSGRMPVCNVACGSSAAVAVTQAKARCQDKQQRACPITASVPVSLETLSAPSASAASHPTQ